MTQIFQSLHKISLKTSWKIKQLVDLFNSLSKFHWNSLSKIEFQSKSLFNVTSNSQNWIEISISTETHRLFMPKFCQPENFLGTIMKSFSSLISKSFPKCFLCLQPPDFPLTQTRNFGTLSNNKILIRNCFPLNSFLMNGKLNEQKTENLCVLCNPQLTTGDLRPDVLDIHKTREQATKNLLCLPL